MKQRRRRSILVTAAALFSVLTAVAIGAADPAATIARNGNSPNPTTSITPTALLPTAAVATASTTAAVDPAERWFRLPIVPRNNNVADMDEVLDAVATAKANGFTHVLIGDPIINRLDTSGAFHALWRANVDRVVEAAKSDPNPLRVVFAVASFGRCQSSLLANDPNLATGYPLSTPLRTTADGTELVGVAPPPLANASFNDYDGNRFAGFDGYVPSHVARAPGRTDNGSAMIARRTPGGDTVSSANLTQALAVQPMSQYRLTIWVKTDDLTAASIFMRVRGADGRSLSSLAFTGNAGFRQQNRTIGWTPFQVAFNSTTNTSVTVAFGAEGITGGSVQFDDISVEATPTLNLLNRPGLNRELIVTDADGQRWTAMAGSDYELVDPSGQRVDADPELARFTVTHAPPRMRILPGGRLSAPDPGRSFTLNGHHAFVHFLGSVSCSWNDPAAISMVAEIVEHAETFGADGFLIPHDEIRSGGWEPYDNPDSSLALNDNVDRVFAAARSATDRPLYMWHDMIDPAVHEESNLFHIRTRLTRAVDVPDGVTVLVWDNKPPPAQAGDAADRRDATVVAGRAAALRSMNDRADRLLIAGYYDTDDIELDARLWREAYRQSATTKVGGSMYATWGLGDLSDLAEFAQHWPPFEDPGPPPPPTTSTVPSTTQPPSPTTSSSTVPSTTAPSIPTTTQPPAPSGRIVGGIELNGAELPVVVDLFSAGADGARSGYLTSTRPSDDGGYSFAVAEGCYVVVLVSPPGITFVETNQQWIEAALCVADGETGIGPSGRLAIQPGDDDAFIGDRVVNDDGSGAAGVLVDLFAANADGSRSRFLADQRSAADGGYGFSVVPDCYVVVFSAPPNRLFTNASPYYQESRCVGPGHVVDDIDPVLRTD